jgi:hypothetical protein
MAEPWFEKRMGWRNDATKRNSESMTAGDGLETGVKTTEPKGKKMPAALAGRRNDG